MIRGYEIIFGYGTVAVGCENKYITFQTVNHAGEISSCVDEAAAVGKIIKLDMSTSYDSLLNQLVRLHPIYYPRIHVDGYILDFTNYNNGSVEIVVNYARAARENYLKLSAC